MRLTDADRTFLHIMAMRFVSVVPRRVVEALGDERVVDQQGHAVVREARRKALHEQRFEFGSRDDGARKLVDYESKEPQLARSRGARACALGKMDEAMELALDIEGANPAKQLLKQRLVGKPHGNERA